MPAVKQLAFISHHHEDREIASSIDRVVQMFGFEGFLAHRDLDGGTEWLREIKEKIANSVVLIAVLTPKFVESDWTDHEVGFATGKGVPVLPIIVNSVKPYGFMADIQGTRWDQDYKYYNTSDSATHDALIGNALKARGVLDRAQIIESLCSSGSFHATRVLILGLGDIESVSDPEVITIARAVSKNKHLNDCNEAKAAFSHRIERVRNRLDNDVYQELTSLGVLSQK